MITFMMNQKQELTDTISCPAMERPGRQTTSLKIGPRGESLTRQMFPLKHYLFWTI